MTRLAIFAFGYVAGLVVAGLLLIVASYREERPRTPPDWPDGMCPNCVTPWKCNGPHLEYREDDDGVQPADPLWRVEETVATSPWIQP